MHFRRIMYGVDGYYICRTMCEVLAYPVLAFNLNKSNYNGVKDLSNLEWENKLRDRSLDEQWDIFKQLVHNIQCEFISIGKRDSVRKRHNLW